VSAPSSSVRPIARRTAPLLLLFGLSCTVTSADAQTQAQAGRGAQRPFRGLFGGSPTPDPNRTRQELSLTGNVLVSYDNNLATAAAGGGGAEPNADGPGGYLGTGSLDVHYFRGRQIRSFAIDGSAFVTKYGQSIGMIEGGSVTVAGTTQMRRRDRFSASQSFSYEPLLTLGSFDPLVPVDGANSTPENSQFAGLEERRSLGAQGTADYQWSMSRRNSLGFNYGFQAQRYLDSDSSLGNSQSHRGAATYTRTLTRTFGLRGSYNYSYGRVEDVDGTRPLTQQTIEGGPQYSKSLSRTRRIQASAGVGGQNARTLASVSLRRTPVEYWTPFGTASANLDLASNWRLRADYRRSTVVLPEVTSESYVTDAITLGTNTLLGERLDLDFSFGLAGGTSAIATGSSATYRTSTVAATARWALARQIALLLNYYYYDYVFTNTTDLPEGFSPTTRRHTVRVGITLWQPLIGNYVASRGSNRP
jgi:hypothetical protein